MNEVHVNPKMFPVAAVPALILVILATWALARLPRLVSDLLEALLAVVGRRKVKVDTLPVTEVPSDHPKTYWDYATGSIHSPSS